MRGLRTPDHCDRAVMLRILAVACAVAATAAAAANKKPNGEQHSASPATHCLPASPLRASTMPLLTGRRSMSLPKLLQW